VADAPLTFDLGALSLPERGRLLTRVVAPRPIAFVSSRSASGVGNLAPFSFFTAGGSNPPSLVFCAVNDRHGKQKDTVRNIEETQEYVVSIVSAPMAARMNQASFEYPPDVDEFDAAGFTRAPSTRVAPPGVAESPVRMECRLQEIVRHGTGPQASNYVIGELLLIHVDPVACTDGLPDNAKLQQLGRLGADLYLTVEPDDLWSLARPRTP
jgi:flavin reductase (DIM6/NTAB) family NADH-FMN oxidoreductase RutF